MIEVMKDNERKDFAVLELSDYLRLKQLAKINCEVKPVMIKTSDILFLCALIKELNANSDSELTILKDTVTLKVQTKGGYEINSSFDIKLCEKYYNRITKFIEEVL